MPESVKAFTERQEGDVAVLVFADYVDQSRTRDDDAGLERLSEERNIVCDLTQTRAVSSDWIRWLVKLTLSAEKRGRWVRLAKVQPAVLETADAIAAKKHLRVYPTVAAALAP